MRQSPWVGPNASYSNAYIEIEVALGCGTFAKGSFRMCMHEATYTDGRATLAITECTFPKNDVEARD